MPGRERPDSAGTVAVRDDAQFSAGPLREWMQTHVPSLFYGNADAQLTIRQFPSGFSNLTYQVSVAGNGAGTESHHYVLRRPPRGVKPGIAHDMGREHDLLAALHAVGVPVPRPLARCDYAAVIGAPFYLMEYVDGLILRGASLPGVRADDGAASQIMTALSHTFVATLAQLHAVDVTQEPLASFGRREGYVSRQIHGWTKRWHASRTEPVPDLDRVAQWLDAHQPPDRGATLIHNDFKFDNLVLDRETNRRVIAILDWEMATIGDPLMDLGTSLAYWVEADDAPVFRSLGLGVTSLPGCMTRAELIAAYGVVTDRDVSDAAFYYAFGLFKLAIIAQQIYARHVQGLTSDPRFAQLGVVVAALGDAAVRVTDTGVV